MIKSDNKSGISFQINKPENYSKIVDYFVICKSKCKSTSSIETDDVPLKKLEIRAYRQYEEFTR